MLGIFHKAVAQAPQELHSPESAAGIPPKSGSVRRQPKNPDEILRDFHAAYSGQSFSASFSGGAALACVGPRAPRPSFHQRYGVVVLLYHANV